MLVRSRSHTQDSDSQNWACLYRIASENVLRAADITSDSSSLWASESHQKCIYTLSS